MRHKRIAACTAAALCIGMLTFPASAASEDFPAWASQAAKRWEDCGKLEEILTVVSRELMPEVPLPDRTEE